MYLDLLGPSGFLSDGCRKELGLDSWLELGGGSVGHLLLLLSWLGCLHCHLLGSDLREISKLQLIQEKYVYIFYLLLL